MRVRVTAEKVNMAMIAPELSNQIKNSQCNEYAASDKRKRITNSIADRHATPYDQAAERGCEERMTDACKSGYRESFRLAPVLRARRDHEWKPMSRNHGVQKTDSKSCSCQAQKDNAIHVRRHLILLVLMRQDGKQLRRASTASATEL
jgi:hypothetical protein